MNLVAAAEALEGRRTFLVHLGTFGCLVEYGDDDGEIPDQRLGGTTQTI